MGAEVLAAGVEEVRRARATNEIPYALVEADPAIATPGSRPPAPRSRRCTARPAAAA